MTPDTIPPAAIALFRQQAEDALHQLVGTITPDMTECEALDAQAGAVTVPAAKAAIVAAALKAAKQAESDCKDRQRAAARWAVAEFEQVARDAGLIRTRAVKQKEQEILPADSAHAMIGATGSAWIEGAQSGEPSPH